jgi:putative lipoic acid-binding regulatory protein
MVSSHEQHSIDLLNDTHDFPTRLLVKVIGANDPSFVDRVLAVVRSQIELDGEPPFTTRATPHGRHIAVTLEPLFDNAEQVLAVYAALRQIDGVVMLL